MCREDFLSSISQLGVIVLCSYFLHKLTRIRIGAVFHPGVD